MSSEITTFAVVLDTYHGFTNDFKCMVSKSKFKIFGIII